jgi:hypothetical protein
MNRFMTEPGGKDLRSNRLLPIKEEVMKKCENLKGTAIFFLINS